MRGEPAKLADTVLPGTYPVAVMVSPPVPTAPLDGEILTVAPTMKLVLAAAELVPSDTTTLSAPPGTDGTLNLTAPVPLVPVVPPELMVATVPPTVTVSDFEPRKPWTEI